MPVAESNRSAAELGVPDADRSLLDAEERSAAGIFAAELKCQRKRLGWTQVQLGDRIGFSGSFISDIERGERNAVLEFAKACDREMGLPGTFERLHELTRREAYPSWFSPVLPFERTAVRIHGWSLGAVPGLLQTEDYARAVVQARSAGRDEAWIAKTVTARLDRQEILSGARSPLLWYVLHEGLLRHVIGGPEVMTQQLDKLLKVADMPGIVLQILPYTAHDHAGVEGPIVIYERRDERPVAYTECYGGGRIVETYDEVADLTTVMSLLRAAALSPRESVALIRQIRSGLNDH